MKTEEEKEQKQKKMKTEEKEEKALMPARRILKHFFSSLCSCLLSQATFGIVLCYYDESFGFTDVAMREYLADDDRVSSPTEN